MAKNKNNKKNALRPIVEEIDGTEQAVSKELWEARRETLREEVEAAVPGFAKACQDAHAAKSKVFMHQNAFGAMFSEHDILLLGKAIKYAGFYPDATIMIGGSSTYGPEEEAKEIDNAY
jgi:hypothetical protein